MPMSSDSTYPDHEPQALVLNERGIEEGFIAKLRDLKYIDRPDIRDRAALENNFRDKFEALNRVRLTDGEFARLLDGIAELGQVTMYGKAAHRAPTAFFNVVCGICAPSVSTM